MSDPDLTPISKTHQRLKAAAQQGEESTLPGSVCRAKRNGVFLIHCFICGSAVTPGKELSLQAKYQREKDGPFFPFLQGQDPAPGALEIGPNGDALVCAVCHCFLCEQWNSFERNRTPTEKRMYWLKRPYQCDLRSVSYDLEQRMSVGNYDANDSDFSFSDNDNMSEQDLDFSGGFTNNNNHPTVFRESNKPSKNGNRQDAVNIKSSPESALCPVRLFALQDVPKSDSDGRASKFINHTLRLSVSMTQQQNDIPSVHTPVANNATVTYNNSAVSEVSDSCKMNFSINDERESATSSRLNDETSPSAKHHNFVANECACYICGSQFLTGGHFRVFVQKQESASSEPFFPFLWLHTPPPGAVPLSPGGYTLVCSSCHSSLIQQWQRFEVADVPVLQRLYVVPLSAGVATPSVTYESEHGLAKIHPTRNQREACYLCGQECGKEIRVVYAHFSASNACSAMYFPFINSLPCPPNAQKVRNGRVHSCVTCHRILEDVWAEYCLCLREELITSVSTFLGKYHLAIGRGEVMASGLSGPLSVTTTTSHSSICYLCGEELFGGMEYQVHVNPPGRCGQQEPFFPFLTVHPPPPRARPVDTTGLVSACVLCYHDLLAQWTKHESQDTGTGPSSSPWSRQYSCNTFVCFFCRKEKKRTLGLKGVHVARLPVFLYAPRVSQTLVIDNGKQLTIGCCVECKSMVLAGQNLKTVGGTAVPKDKVLLVEESVSSSKEVKIRPLAVTAGDPSEKDHPASSEPKLTSSPSSPCSLKLEKGERSMSSMSHEPKSPSLGMISTATRTTATVSPLTSSPLNGSVVPNGSPASQSTHSGFAAALRKLAKQAEEPRVSSISSESSPVSSPATNHSSPVSTPKRGPMGPVIVPPGGHSVPSTPPVVTIAPTKTVNGMWRSEGRPVREAESGNRGIRQDRLNSEASATQEKGGPTVPAHLIGNPYAFALNPASVMQDSRFQPLNLPRQMPHAVPPTAVPEEYLRGFRPYATAEELRMPSLPLGLDPAAAAAAAAYYHPGYLPHPSFSPYRMDDPFCLSALRSPFYPLSGGSALPPLHPSAVHMHLPGVRYPGDISHPTLSSLQSERLSERLQMEDELRQREREREREAEREKEREREREREKELERERERERECERELERQKERLAREKAMESQYLDMHAVRASTDDRVTANRVDKTKESTPKPIQPSLHHSLNSSHHPVPSLVSAHGMYLGTGETGTCSLNTTTMLPRSNEEERWLARQRKLRQEKEDRQYQVSEFRQQVLEQHLDLGRPGETGDMQTEGHRPVSTHHEASSRDRDKDERETHSHLGAPPPLISPKHPHRDHAPPPTTLWNPVSLIETSTDSRRSSHDPPGLGHYDISRLPVLPPKHFNPEKLEEVPLKRNDLDKYSSIRPSGFSEPNTFLADLEKSTQSFLKQHRAPLSLSGAYGELSVGLKPRGSFKAAQGPPRLAPDALLVYDEFLQQHRRAVSKLDMEERKRREAREKGYYYDLDDSYDESDEEEVKAHLRRVADQPPLKLDDSTEKVEFLRMFGLTTLARREELMEVKRRKRRRMLRERSPSPPAIQNKRPISAPLSTRFTPEDMNNSSELEDKKRFLTSFSLNHITQQQRKDNERVEELLLAIKQKSVTLDSIRHNPQPLCGSPTALCSDQSSHSPFQADDELLTNELSTSPVPSVSGPPPTLDLRSSPDPLRPKEVPLPAVLSDKKVIDTVPGKTSSLLNSVRQPLFTKESSASVNGKTRPWESFIAEEFAQQFHESVLQSTQKALQKSKGGASVISEQNHMVDSSVHYNIPELQSTAGRSKSQTNGQRGPPPPCYQELPAEEEFEDGEEEDDTEEEEEAAFAPRWQGIEAIFEAYQEYTEEQSIERQVLHNQCRRLETHHYNLSLTAEQLSHSMGELMAQKQKLAAEREKLQAELEHFKKCLTLPQTPWSRTHFKGYSPR
ncbi:genetic suppressor element 1 isoform X1 [Misgurnus anguillicaudatus]|uniref:genetic suppressor element 1 isoform X1 n=1 Tax=Misgurnus anguillicaudatus TaxID=75329 RepID=UPI003CCF7890